MESNNNNNSKMPPSLFFNLVLAMALMVVSFSPAVVLGRAAGAGSAARRVTPQGITCPPEDESDPGPTLEEIYYYSDVVVMGKVTERHRYRGQVYTAEMDVYCVYKGANVPAHINITDAGNVANLCFSTDFKVGVSYVAYLKRHRDGRLSPSYQQHPEGYTDEMIFICDISVTLPVGLSELPDGGICEDKATYDYGSDYGKEGESQNITCFSFDPEKDKDKTYKHEEAKDQDGGEVKKGQVKDDGDDDDDGNGSGTLRLSLLLLALVHAVVLVFS